MDDKYNTFSYTYSAKQQEEVKRIRQKYIPPEENRLEQLRKLDESATRPGRVAAITLGAISALVLGIGMCCTMVWTQFFVLGVVIGVIGLAGMGASLPLYSELVRRQRKKLTPQIMQLSHALLDKE